MEFNLIPKKMKLTGILIMFVSIILFLSYSALHLENVDFQRKWLEYFWALTIYSCFINAFIRRKEITKLKLRTIYFTLILSLVVFYCFIPECTFNISTITILILTYNIIFISILYELSKINLHGLFYMMLNIIIGVGILTGIYIVNTYLILSYSTTITYLISFVFILYIIITLKTKIFKIENLYKFFIIVGNLITIIFYFVLLLFFHINNLHSVSTGLILFVSTLQPIFYFIGMNFILVEE